MNLHLRRRLSVLVLSAVTVAGAAATGAVPAYAAMPNRSCGQVTSADSAVADQLNRTLTGDWAGAMNPYRASCARAIINTVRGLGLSDRASAIAVTTAMVESGLENNPNVLDHTSVGLFQQLDSWGSTENRLDPAWSTTAFINEMLRMYPNNSWQSAQIGVVCQAVQRSAYPARYPAQVANALKIVNAIGSPTSPPASSMSSGSVSTVYNPDTRTAEAFAIDEKGHMQHAYSTDRAKWSEWIPVDDRFEFTGGPAAVYNPVDKVTEVFGVGAKDGVMSHAYMFNGQGWSGFVTLRENYRFVGSPGVVYNAATDAIEVFGIGTDGVMNHTYNLKAGVYQPWESLPSDRKFAAGRPAAVYNPDTLTAEVFARDRDGIVAHSWSTNGGVFQPRWWDIDNSFRFASDPAVAYNPVNKVTEVFAVGSAEGMMSHAYVFNGQPWSGWKPLDNGFRFVGGPAAVYNGATNAIELFGIGQADGAMNHNYNINAGPWNGWENFKPGWAFSGTPSAVYEPDFKAAEVFAIGSKDGLVSHSYTANGQPMSDWFTIGSTPFKVS
ncbi:hypothetical protein ACFQ6N_27165 [Kitasatospora sp. NPDC056446]|uniref:hypothetical protein n=1 Tax=Kitasatospora sp. NPDC056446 TaxID=3345819 RepID=UPI003681804C